MNRYDALGRELMGWFDETAAPRRPDYTTDIVRMTASLPQRRWTSVERWIPMNVVEFRRRTVPPFPWKTVAVLVALLALLVAGLAYVGSQPRLPPPFGLACFRGAPFPDVGRHPSNDFASGLPRSSIYLQRSKRNQKKAGERCQASPPIDENGAHQVRDQERPPESGTVQVAGRTQIG